MVTLADTFNVECPKCRALPGRFCPIRSTTNDDPAGTWSHDERWTAAQAKAASNDAALLALARCFPPGLLAEAAALLTERGAKTGAGPTDTVDGQTFDDHVEHADEHMIDVALGCATDVDSGRHPIAHVVARMALAYEMAMRARGVGE